MRAICTLYVAKLFSRGAAGASFLHCCFLYQAVSGGCTLLRQGLVKLSPGLQNLRAKGGRAVAVSFAEIRWENHELSGDRLAGAAGVRCPLCQAACWHGGTSLRHVAGVWHGRQPLVLEGLDGRQSLACQQAPRWCTRLCK